MDQKQIIVWNCKHLQDDKSLNKLIKSKKKIPLAKELANTNLNASINLKCNKFTKKLPIEKEMTLVTYKNYVCLNIIDNYFQEIYKSILSNEYLFIIVEGSPDQSTIILYFCNQNVFSECESENEEIRFGYYDLPPLTYTVVDTKKVRSTFYSYLAKKEPELFSLRTQKFIQNPHILTYLFSQVMSLESKEHINYISVLKVLADHLRDYLKPYIKKIKKDHHSLWGTYYGERISFLDGGMSRIVSLPGTEPMGIRVGIYTVTPGETNLNKREEWSLKPFVIGDVVNDRSHIKGGESQTDVKRLQEAARYILEPLVGYDYIKSSKTPPKVMFLHGPLQNSFQIYDEDEPNFVPAVDPEFLANFGIMKNDIFKNIQDIPKDYRNEIMWNGCIPVYALIMKYIFESPIPIVGVVERGHSRNFCNCVLRMLGEMNVIPKSTRISIWNKLKKYEIGDELLFGCILDEGEYIEPLEMPKNTGNRAHEKWKLVVNQFPVPTATIIKCSGNKFPYRVEFNGKYDSKTIHDIASLLYHTSLLLPNYSFPVGIDIADKYAKIPDWISKGISARLTATVIKKVLDTGDDRMLRQVRQLLALSPRDFFFRPKM